MLAHTQRAILIGILREHLRKGEVEQKRIDDYFRSSFRRNHELLEIRA